MFCSRGCTTRSTSCSTSDFAVTTGAARRACCSLLGLSATRHCYKAFFASGASTVSPIFHTLDAFRGTLVVDEGDFRFSDEKADIVKILNNGNVRGIPVLRTLVTPQGEFNPKAFHVFGPKLV